MYEAEVMAVLVEGISVIVREDAIKNKMNGGWERFRLLIPNQTFCKDSEVARVGFMEPAPLMEFVEQLEEFGLTYLDDGAPVDLIVVDQQRGPMVKCEWIEFAHIGIDGGKVGAAWLWDEPRKGHGIRMKMDMTIAMPPGWHFKDSLSDKFEFVPNSLMPERKDH
jgi:hypothetical protein